MDRFIAPALNPIAPSGDRDSKHGARRYRAENHGITEGIRPGLEITPGIPGGPPCEEEECFAWKIESAVPCGLDLGVHQSGRARLHPRRRDGGPGGAHQIEDRQRPLRAGNKIQKGVDRSAELPVPGHQ